MAHGSDPDPSGAGPGGGAAEEIAAAIRWANLHQAADLIITGRGRLHGGPVGL